MQLFYFSSLFALLLVQAVPREVSVPIVDVTALFHYEEGTEFGRDLKAVINAIDEALRSCGVFLLTAQDFKAPGYLQRFLEAARILFQLPIDQKESVSIESNELRGYLSMGSESGLESIYEPKEGFAYGFDWTKEKLRYKTNDMQIDNVWPATLQENDRRNLNRFFQLSTKLATLISHSLESFLQETYNEEDSKGNERSTLSNIADDGDTISLMRLFHYFAKNSSDYEAVLGSSPHTDWGYLTIILQDDVGGLQFLYENEWINVPAIPGTLVVNGGDFLQLLSRGRYKSPIHRVVCPTEEQGERYSFVYFYYPGYDTEFDQLQTRIVEEVNANGQDTEPNNKNKWHYNTLLKSPGSVFDVKFGAYIRKKWRDVFRK